MIKYLLPILCSISAGAHTGHDHQVNLLKKGGPILTQILLVFFVHFDIFLSIMGHHNGVPERKSLDSCRTHRVMSIPVFKTKIRQILWSWDHFY